MKFFETTIPLLSYFLLLWFYNPVPNILEFYTGSINHKYNETWYLVLKTLDTSRLSRKKTRDLGS